MARVRLVQRGHALSHVDARSDIITQRHARTTFAFAYSGAKPKADNTANGIAIFTTDTVTLSPPDTGSLALAYCSTVLDSFRCTVDTSYRETNVCADRRTYATTDSGPFVGSDAPTAVFGFRFRLV